MCAARCTANRRSISVKRLPLLVGQLWWDGPAAGDVPGAVAGEQVELQRGADVDAVQLVGVLVAELAGDERADVAAGGGVPAWPSVWVISSCQRSAIFQKFMSGRVGVEYPKPGKDGTITSNASAGSPPNSAGSASRSMTFDQCQNVQGQPWLRISGSGVRSDAGLAHEVNGRAGHVDQVVLVGVHRPLGGSPVVVPGPVLVSS